MRTKFKLMLLIALAGLTVLAGHVRGRNSAPAVDNNVNPHYKGGSSFNFVGAVPNPARCGAFPQNVELSFTGGGTDTEGGVNTAVFSACTNTTTNEVFNLKATDTYVQTGDSVNIEADSFILEPNLANCTAANQHPVPFRVTGGTGAYANATGQGYFHIASNLTPCNGIVAPSQVWFSGVISK